MGSIYHKHVLAPSKASNPYLSRIEVEVPSSQAEEEPDLEEEPRKALEEDEEVVEIPPDESEMALEQALQKAFDEEHAAEKEDGPLDDLFGELFGDD